MQSTEKPVFRSRAWAIAGGLVLLLFALLMTVGAGAPEVAYTVVAASLLLSAAVCLAAWGTTQRQRLRYEDELTSWARDRAIHSERLRLARELHDLASHGLGAITVRAAVARAIDGPDADAERLHALGDIEETSRTATSELRQMLTLLRSPGEHHVPLEPTVSQRDVASLIAEAEAAGVTVTHHIVDVEPLAPELRPLVTAVVREALTNTTRHAGPCNVNLTVSRQAGELRVVVDDDGPAPGWQPKPGTHLGLVGLRERLTQFGGTLLASPRPRGYRLEARIPLHAHE